MQSKKINLVKEDERQWSLLVGCCPLAMSLPSCCDDFAVRNERGKVRIEIWQRESGKKLPCCVKIRAATWHSIEWVSRLKRYDPVV